MVHQIESNVVDTVVHLLCESGRQNEANMETIDAGL
jgi:hypothetical protein